MKKSLLFFSILAGSTSLVSAQCINVANKVDFSYGGKTYEIIKEAKTWAAASACATERGGYLAEINSLAENTAIANALSTAGITMSSTSAPDGGGGSYVWIGGNDMTVEGTWKWSNSNTQFWSGTGATGAAVGGLYNNWGGNAFGKEPDDYGSGQDNAALSLNGWPLGSAGQWNDVSGMNSLYFVIESSTVLGTGDVKNNADIRIQNPVKSNLIIQNNSKLDIKNLEIFSLNGQLLKSFENKKNATSFDATFLEIGVYVVKIILENNTEFTTKIIKK